MIFYENKFMKNRIRNLLDFITGIFLVIQFRIKKTKIILHSDILFFLPYYHMGGAEKVHLNVIKAVNSTAKVTIIFTHRSATENLKTEFLLNAHCIEINNIRNKKNKFVTNLLNRLIVKTINKSTKIISIFGSNTPYYYELIPNIKDDVVKIDLFHAFTFPENRENYIISSARYINKRVVINEKARADLFEIYNRNGVALKLKDKIQIINNGVEILNSPIRKEKSSTFKAGFSGRWSVEKRPELFLRIAENFMNPEFNIQFEMIGSGMKQNLIFIEKCGVKFLGEINEDSKLIHFYEQIDILLITSKHEGFPMVIMEAMSHGVIPISTNVGGIDEHIINNENGFLIDGENEDEIVFKFCEIIKYLEEDRARVVKISRAATKYASENFCISNFNSLYSQLFEC